MKRLVNLMPEGKFVTDRQLPDGARPWHVGMVLVRRSREMQAESYSQELIAGINESIAAAGGTFLVKVVGDEAEERETYEQWAEAGIIGSVIIEEFTVTDTRRDLLEGLGLDVTVFGDLELAGNRPVIWTDHAGAMRILINALYELGHRVIARVSGPMHFTHSRARSASFAEIGTELGMQVSEAVGDYSRKSGSIATRKLLDDDPNITAIIFDGDLMALGGIDLLNDIGKAVPEDISVVAWDDSVRGQMSIPPLAALSHDVREIGQIAGRAVAEAHEGRIIRAAAPLPTHVRRGSLGPPNSRILT
jgi:LacI family repressor for deo operon, udp, cdd, tsx, nupC, and nupG